jgi:hypothetical protein
MGAVKIRGEGGVVWTFDLPLPEDIAKRVTSGHLRMVDEEPEASDSVARPAKNAAKALWVGWAVRVHGFTPDDAEAATKDELQELPDAPAADESDEE